MKYPGAIGPALRLYGRVLKAHWPMLLALTVAYPLVNWGATLAWKALPVATGWVEIGLNGLQIVVWAMAWGLMGAVLAHLTLATGDRRATDPGALLRACASALPVVCLFVLAADVTSLPLSLWKTHLVATDRLKDHIDLVGWLGLPFAALDAAIFWFFVMAVPIRLDRDLSLIETLKASARLGRRRWRTMLLVFALAGVGLVLIGLLFIVIGIAQVEVTQAEPANATPPGWAKDTYLWQIPFQMLSMVWMLFWPVLYVVFRDQEGAGEVVETFD